MVGDVLFISTARHTSDLRMDCAAAKANLAASLPYRYVLFDRDAKFSGDVFEFLQASALKPIRTSVRSPWQNGVAERWIGSAHREVRHHIIPLNDRHLRRLGREYIDYYHQDRTHIGLEKTTPASRPVELRPTEPRPPRALLRIGGLHHRYTWAIAA